MTKRHKVATCLPVALALAATLAAQVPPPAAKPDSVEVRQHVDRARKMAGKEWSDAANFFCAPDPDRANRPDDPEIEPAKIFDNVYVIGRTGTAVYAITTADGIILIDSGYADQIESVLLPGIQKLELDPAKVKVIVLGHGHADHFGGAPYFQQKYGTRVAMAAADWDMVEHPAAPLQVKPPTRDIVVTEEQPITLGDTRITAVMIPGHTPGSTGLIFPVKDGGTMHVAALLGGTILIPGRISDEALQQYLRSIDHFAEVTKKMNVDVELQNHPLYDGIVERLKTLRTRAPRKRHPFVVGRDGYQRFLNVMSECMKAQIGRRARGGSLR